LERFSILRPNEPQYLPVPHRRCDWEVNLAAEPHYNAHMPTREQLHELIESMPEEAIQASYRVLSYLQAPSISGDMRHLLQTRLLQLKPLMKPGIAPEFDPNVSGVLHIHVHCSTNHPLDLPFGLSLRAFYSHNLIPQAHPLASAPASACRASRGQLIELP
jgi:hypothetical protein